MTINYRDMSREHLESLACRLAAALQDLVSSDPDMLSHRETCDAADRIVTEAEDAGLVAVVEP